MRCYVKGRTRSLHAGRVERGFVGRNNAGVGTGCVICFLLSRTAAVFK